MSKRTIEVLTVMIMIAIGATACVNRQNSDVKHRAAATTKASAVEQGPSTAEQSAPTAEENLATTEESGSSASENTSTTEEEESIADVIKASGDNKTDPQEGQPGSQEFGLTTRQLRDNIEAVEAVIAKCMREQGFEYIAVDYVTIKKGMGADKNISGMSEGEFIDTYGFGVATMYTGKPPQLTDGYSPARVGLGERNVQIYRSLSPADQVAYNRALFGENIDATLAVALETENLSRCGGCTRKAIEEVFEPEQLKASYYNPLDALINKDRRMKAALRYYAREIRAAGFDYSHPDEVEPDIRERLAKLTGGESILVEKMSPEQRTALKRLQDYERRVAAKNFQFQEEVIDPVEERIQEELFSRKVQ